MIGAVVALIGSFAVAAILSPLVKKVAHRLKAGQPILHYVVEHAGKQGTPTAGGWIFILPAVVVPSIVVGEWGVAGVASACMLAYAVLGFLDDYLKIRRADNGGLRPYQKILGQLGIALVLGFYVWQEGSIGEVILLPFTHRAVSLGWGIIPFVALVFIAGTNAVNLTDGLDGLAGATSLVYMGGFVAMAAVGLGYGLQQETLYPMTVFALCVAGGLLAYLISNVSKAQIFMGDTGSMALGGAVCATCVFSRFTLYLPLMGIMFAVSCISVIMQVGYFRLSKGKRLLLMAPLHHHLQRKGWSESRVCMLYVALTCIAAALAVLGVYVGCYGVEG